MYGETFYGRHIAQHQLQWRQIKIKNAIRLEEIHSMLIYGNDNASSTSTQITKVTESISCVSSICINHRSTSLSHRTNQLLNFYENRMYSLLSQPLA